ncbi:MAG: prephenate dehydrogenase/arogenate dehydrogenase family protein, partial [Acetobacteraceae bacterium]|nr:prephenate dehydrogenase/arogenate dehydrogenase family protein [Acetobacteraceae bacterium]
MGEPLFERLCLIGAGLIGGSIARVARERGDIARSVVAHSRRPETLARIRELGFADVVEADPARAVRGADGVILCVPVGAYARVMESIAPRLMPGAVLTDVGSTKGSVIRDLAPLLPAGVHLVPAHPMAGTEHSGPDAGFATLFQGRYCILTPEPGTDAAAVERVAELWRRCGSMVETMDAATHDKVVAIVSHLPHLIA